MRLGEHDTSKDPDCDEIECMPPVQDIPIEEIKFHPQFNQPRFSNDIAVLRLRYDADLTRGSKHLIPQFLSEPSPLIFAHYLYYTLYAF